MGALSGTDSGVGGTASGNSASYASAGHSEVIVTGGKSYHFYQPGPGSRAGVCNSRSKASRGDASRTQWAALGGGSAVLLGRSCGRRRTPPVGGSRAPTDPSTCPQASRAYRLVGFGSSWSRLARHSRLGERREHIASSVSAVKSMPVSLGVNMLYDHPKLS